jgi:peptide/nickel transport system substrate-binding protein
LPGNWFRLGKFLNFREKIFVAFLLLVILASISIWVSRLYVNFTKAIPAQGGTYNEGVVGQPSYINPLLSQTSEADADLVELIYSGLLKYDGQGNLVNNLAESYEISQDQKTYTFHVRKDVKWHDGEPLTAADVFFTVNAVQDPAYKSPLRQSWQGVEISQKDEYTVEFLLKNPYFGFLNNLTLGILPKHIWENITPEKFSLVNDNLRPIGSGPYRVVDFQKDSSGNILSYALHSFKDYFDRQANISEFNFYFYPDDDVMIDAYNKKEIDGMGNITPEKIDAIKTQKSTVIHSLNIPRYFAIFFNQTKSIPLATSDVRQALAYGTDRQEIIDRVLHGKGISMYSPFLPQMKEYENDVSKYDYNISKAQDLLDKNGWKINGDNKIREKNGEKLEIEIFTTDWPELAQTADIIREQWEKIGVGVKVNVLTVSDLQQNYIRPREYESLLFGQAVNFNSDPYPFWHSSQKRDPGLNLSLFDNKKADELLDAARQEMDEGKRIQDYRDFQKIVSQEIPAIFLYSPNFLYPVNQKVKGIETQNVNTPSLRFAEVNKWYIKTKRVKK